MTGRSCRPALRGKGSTDGGDEGLVAVRVLLVQELPPAGPKVRVDVAVVLRAGPAEHVVSIIMIGIRCFPRTPAGRSGNAACPSPC